MSPTANLVIHPQIPNVTTNDGPNMVAAQGRSYGANAKFPSLINLTYTLPKVGGLIPGVGPTPASVVSPVSLVVTKTPTGISCAMPSPLPDPTQPQTNCNSGGPPLPTTAVTSTLVVTASDPGNLAVPGASSTTNDTLSVVAALQIPGLSQASNPTPTNWFPGVSGRSYGIIGAAPTSTAAGGLGAVAGSTSKYAWCISPNSSPLPGGLGGISPSAACGVSSTTMGGTATLTSSSLSNVTSQAMYNNIQVELDDTGNLAVPDSRSANASTTSTPASITVNAPLVASISQNGSSNPPTLLQGIVGRSYGVIGAPPAYSVAGGFGTGTYLWCLVGTLPGGFGGASTICGKTTSTKEDTFNLTANPVSGSPATFPGIQGETGDAGNAAVPDAFSSGSTSRTTASSITIDAALAAMRTQNGANCAPTLLTGVVGRSYGIINSNAGETKYTASGGFGSSSYLWCVTGTLPGGFTGAPSTTCGTTTSTPESGFNLTAASVTTSGTFANITGEVGDAGNAAVPGSFSPNTSGTTTTSVDIASSVSVTTTTLPNALLEFATYSQTLDATGGLPAYTWVAPGATSGACATAPSGSLPPGLSLAATGVLSGTPTTASSTATDFQFQVCAADTANAATPAGSAFGPPPPPSSGEYTLNVLNPLAQVADPGQNQVEVINTGTPSMPPSDTVVATLAVTEPDSVAVTPDGLQTLCHAFNREELCRDRQHSRNDYRDLPAEHHLYYSYGRRHKPGWNASLYSLWEWERGRRC